MQNKSRYVWALLISVLFFHVNTMALELTSGLDPVPDKLLDSMWEAPQGPFIPDAVISKSDNEYYWLFRGTALGLFNDDQNLNIDGWTLTRWPTEVNDESLGAFTSNYSGDWYDYGLTLDTWVDRKGIGCLTDAPLRYGDIEDDGTNELVLLLGDVDRTLDLLVFSPEQETVTFGMRAAFQDSFPAEFPDKAGYEYVSEIDMRSPYPAERIYAKVFVGEFDGDAETTNELIVWRKRYSPYPVGSSNQGFYLDQSSFEHYVQADEYQRQATEQATIQQWLTANNLRWPDGYPNVSECEDQEGQLIPEMHDPLLNDPDVLPVTEQ